MFGEDVDLGAAAEEGKPLGLWFQRAKWYKTETLDNANQVLVKNLSDIKVPPVSCSLNVSVQSFSTDH